MRRIAIFTAVLALAISCKVQQTGENTYKVVAPTPQARVAAERAKVEVRKVGEKLKHDASIAAQKTGTALQHAGRQIERHAKTNR